MTKYNSKRTTWPKGPTRWTMGGIMHISVPFTWNLPALRDWIVSTPLDVVVGGPAVQLMPEYLDGLPNVTIGTESPGVLQRVNPMATRTTTGCVNRCKFCGIGRGLIEPGGFIELDDWPDLPILTDNNILAASPEHFDRVMDRLERWDARKVETDMNQGVDARLLNDHHAERFGRLKHNMVRLAMDHMGMADEWEEAFRRLRKHGVALRRIRSYCLIGFTTGPAEAWSRCEWVESHRIKALPMWFHALNQLEHNIVTKDQAALGWDHDEYKTIMRHYYQHQGDVPEKYRDAA